MTVSHLTTPASNLFQLFLDRYEDDVDLDSLTMSKTEQVAAILSHVAGEPAGANLRLSSTEMIAAILSEETGEPAGANLRMSLAEMLAGIVGGAAFTPETRFASGDWTGAWFDFSQTDRLWQASSQQHATGLADADGDPIGTAMDQAAWGGSTLAEIEASTSELLTDPSFDNAGAWTAEEGATITGGAASWSAAGTNTRVYQTAQPAVSQNNFYRWEATVANYSAGSLSCAIRGSQALQLGTGDGTKFLYFPAGGTSGAINTRLFGASSENTFDVTSASLKLIVGRHANQGTSNSRPQWKSPGFARFDGTADNLVLPGFVPGSTGSIMAYATIPGSISALQVIAGGTVGTSRCFLAVNTLGQLCAGIGSDDETTIVGTTDLRGETVSVALTWDGTDGVRLYVNGVQEYADAMSGSIGTNTLRIGASNNSGTAGNFFGGDIYTILPINEVASAADVANFHTWASGNF